MNSEDKTREDILSFLYNYNKDKARSIAPRMVANRLRDKGIDKQEVTRNINYLIDEGFIKKKTKKVKSSYGPLSFESLIISSKGIQLFEQSKFTRKTFSSISLEGGNNVIVFGDNLGSITQTKGTSIEELNKFIEDIRAKAVLSEEEKMNLIGDIETIKSQLVKPTPSKQIIQAAWAAINVAATFSGAHDFLLKIKNLIVGWLPA